MLITIAYNLFTFSGIIPSAKIKDLRMYPFPQNDSPIFKFCVDLYYAK